MLETEVKKCGEQFRKIVFFSILDKFLEIDKLIPNSLKNEVVVVTFLYLIWVHEIQVANWLDG